MMTLRRRILFVFIAVFILLTGLLFLVSRTVLLDGYRALENEDLKGHLGRVERAIENEWDTLDTTLFDWAAWDDAYAFVDGGSDSFVETNLGDKTFDSNGLRLNVVLFVDLEGNRVFEKGLDWKTARSWDVPNDFIDHLHDSGLLNLPTDTSVVKGFLRLESGLMLVAARPILTSEEVGPQRGTLIMGRKFDAQELTRLGEKLQLDLVMESLATVNMPNDFAAALRELAAGKTSWVSELSGDRIGGYALVDDLYGKPASILRVSMPRKIYLRGLASGTYLLMVVVGVGLIFGVVAVFGLEKWILARLTEMSRRVALVEDSGALSTRLPVTGGDELAQFSRALNDMLERLQATEQELIRLERLSALGELAAGINHNLNNILVGVTVSSEFLLEDVNDPAIRAHVETIFRAGRQAGDLVARLQEAMLGQSEEGALRSVNDVIREAVDAAKPRWKDEAEMRGVSVEVVLDLDSDLPTIRGSSSGLYNMMLNLIFNAVDALPEGGSIEIKSASVADGVQLTVRDTGVGMDAGTSKRVFEPFFTTKAEIGTGLGLSTVYNTIVGWGGKVDVDSVPGAGTVFTIWLPTDHDLLDEGDGAARFKDNTDGRILVVDDQDVVTDLVQDILSPPHEVTCTHSGEIALGLLDGEDYDAVMIDLGMPGIPGDQVAKEIREASPDIALVLITGWRLNDDDERLRLFDFHLKKPLSNLDAVREIMTRAVRLRRARQQEHN